MEICLAIAFLSVRDVPQSFFDIGKVSLASLKPAAGGFVGNLLKTNIAQVATSLVHVTSNATLTTLLLAKEWDNYAHHRKGLRVSTRSRGSQRSTYFLQLPYTYGIPLMIISGTLHWLVSQTIFLVNIDVYATEHQSTGSTNPLSQLYPSRHVRTIVTTSFSFVGLLGIITASILVITSLVILSRRRFKPGIPLAGSCSAAISAACHSIDSEPVNAIEMPLKWGVAVSSASGRGVGHCTFSSLDVSCPEAHCAYAGLYSRRYCA